VTARRRLVRSRPLVLGALVAAFVGSFVAAAYWEWIWWEPYNALLPYLGEGVLFLTAIVLAAIPRARPFALVAAVAGLGLVAGQIMGPSRAELRHGDGTVTIHLTAPVAATGSSAATCATSDGGTELQVSGDPNLRMNIVPDDPAAPADVDQREIVGVFLTVGDRWRRSVRPDEIAFHLMVGRVEAELPGSSMMAGPSTILSVDWTTRAGRAQFADLVPEARANEHAGPFIDVAGTVEWTCDYGD